MQVFLALTLASIGITQSSSLSPDSSKAKTAAASVFGILDSKSNIDPSDEAGTTMENVVGEIVLHNVRFKYPSRPDVQIFRDLSLAIQAGKVCDTFCFFPFFFGLFRRLFIDISHRLLLWSEKAGAGSRQ